MQPFYSTNTCAGVFAVIKCALFNACVPTITPPLYSRRSEVWSSVRAQFSGSTAGNRKTSTIEPMINVVAHEGASGSAKAASSRPKRTHKTSETSFLVPRLAFGSHRHADKLRSISVAG